MNNNNTNMIFYSQKCQLSKDLLILLRNENLLGNFKPMCVDTMLNRLPPDMRVPTMFVVGLNKPLVGQETFEWIKQIKFIRQQQSMDINKRIIQNNTMNNVNNIKKGPLGYDDDILAGISDKFAFTKKDEALPHAYFGVNDDAKNIIFTAPEEKQKINKSLQQKLINDLESKRNEQNTIFSNHMKQEQHNAVNRSEHEPLMQMPMQQMPMQTQSLEQQLLAQKQMLEQQLMQMNNRRF